jgi:hypothetical protein
MISTLHALPTTLHAFPIGLTLSLAPDGQTLRAGPSALLTDEIRQFLRANKPALLARLARITEPWNEILAPRIITELIHDLRIWQALDPTVANLAIVLLSQAHDACVFRDLAALQATRETYRELHASWVDALLPEVSP